MDKKQDKKPLTKEEQMLNKYKAKLKREAVLKSLILGLAAGFFLAAIVSVISFATVKNILWISLVVWGVSTVGLTVLFYFKRYRPDVRTTAQRMDEIGLEERVITMIQFADSDNAMLERQRRDANTAVQSVSVGQMKMRVSKILIILLAVLACISIFMMSFSTVLAVKSEEESKTLPAEEEEELSEEDKIIREMIEKLREEIDAANIDETLRGTLHGMVDDLEARLKPEDSLEVKVAKVMETAEKIHKLIQDYLNRSTIAEELQKYDTTRDLGKAIESKDIDKVRDAFQKMYDNIEPLVKQEKYDLILQTAMDLDQALKDAINTPPDLQKALEDLRDAYLRVLKAIEENPEMTEDEIDQAIQEALDQASDALEDFLEQQQQENEAYEDLDQALQDAIKDAMEQLGQEFEFPDDSGKLPEGDMNGDGLEDEKGDITDGEEDGSEGDGETSGGGDGGNVDSVIDGQTSYKDVFDDDGYSDDIQDKLESGDLSEEDQEIIQDYFDTLN